MGTKKETNDIALRDGENVVEVLHPSRPFTEDLFAPFGRRRVVIITNQRVIVREILGKRELKFQDISDIVKAKFHRVDILKKGEVPAREREDVPAYAPYINITWLKESDEERLIFLLRSLMESSAKARPNLFYTEPIKKFYRFKIDKRWHSPQTALIIIGLVLIWGLFIAAPRTAWNREDPTEFLMTPEQLHDAFVFLAVFGTGISISTGLIFLNLMGAEYILYEDRLTLRHGYFSLGGGLINLSDIKRVAVTERSRIWIESGVITLETNRGYSKIFFIKDVDEAADEIKKRITFFNDAPRSRAGAELSS